MSDGASISFDSATWARILTNSYCQSERDLGILDWVDSAIAEFSSRYDREALPWNMQAALDRGSFATFLGIRFDREFREASVLAVGDTVAVLVDTAMVVAAFPISNAEEFGRSPHLLSTNAACNDFLAGAFVDRTFSVKWDLTNLMAPQIYCMTDALAEWFFRHIHSTPSSMEVLLLLRNQRAFNKLVETERLAHRMRRDDTTFVRLA